MSGSILAADRAAVRSELSSGRPVVLYSAGRPDDLVDLVVAASAASAEWLAFVIRHTAGLVCAAMTVDNARRLGLPYMWRAGATIDPDHAFGVSLDARDGVTTGISATDRARTLRLVADQATSPDELTRPGHLVPLILDPDQPSWSRSGAAVRTVRDAGLGEVAGLASLVSPVDPCAMAVARDAFDFADRFGLLAIARDG